MSILHPKPDVRSAPADRVPARSNDAVLRATGVLSLLAIGAIHFLQIVPTTEATPLLGLAFLVLIVACLVLAARLTIGGDGRSWMATVLITAGAIGGYVFTRMFNTPIDDADVGNWSCMLGLAALFVETTLLASSLYAVMTTRILRPAVTPARRPSTGFRSERPNAA